MVSGTIMLNPKLRSNCSSYFYMTPYGGSQDVLLGNRGEDTLYGGGGGDYLYGETENDLLSGQGGNDVLYGESGNDTLLGGSGNDILNGSNYGPKGRGEYDHLSSGSGADKFVIGDSSQVHYLGNGYATINDFNANEGDKIIAGGDFSDYTLTPSVYNRGTSDIDTVVKYKGDIVAIVVDTSNLSRIFDFESSL